MNNLYEIYWSVVSYVYFMGNFGQELFLVICLFPLLLNFVFKNPIGWKNVAILSATDFLITSFISLNIRHDIAFFQSLWYTKPMYTETFLVLLNCFMVVILIVSKFIRISTLNKYRIFLYGTFALYTILIVFS